MAITLTANYKETLAPEIVEVIDDLIERDYPLETILEFIDYYGEENAEHVEELIDTVDNTDCPKSDLYDFIESYGIGSLEYFEGYWKLLDTYNEGAIEAFIAAFDIEDLHHFEDTYEGYFDTTKDFVEHYLDLACDQVPSWIVVDYEATWDSSLRFDYTEEDGHYFRSC